MADRRISPRAILILFVLLLLICLPLTVGGILYLQGNKDPGAMIGALQRRFAGAPTVVVYITPTPFGTPAKLTTPTPTPTSVDLAKEAGKKVDDAKKFGTAASQEAKENPLTRGFVQILGRSLPKEIPFIGGMGLGDAALGLIILTAFLVLVAAIIARITKSPREKIMGSETVQSFLEDFWTWFVRIAGLAIYVAVIAANIQTNPIKAFLLPAGSAVIVLGFNFVFGKAKDSIMDIVSKTDFVLSNPLVNVLKGGAGCVLNLALILIIVVVGLAGLSGVIISFANVGDSSRLSGEIARVVTNAPFFSDFFSKQLSTIANFISAIIGLGAWIVPNRDLSLIGSLLGTVLLFFDIKISEKLKRTEEE